MIFKRSILRKLELLSKLNPDDFSVEEVAALLGCWKWTTREILSTGVRQGVFTRLANGNYRLTKTAGAE